MGLSALKVCVTGGVGFIGTHLCRALVSQGAEVSVLDLRMPHEGGSGAGILGAVEGVQYLRGDVCDESSLEAATQGAHMLVHLAAKVSVPWCEQHAEESERVNFGGTACAIRVAQKRGIPLLFASSSAVYGDVPVPVKGLSESDAPGGAWLKSLYAKQKWNSEEAIRAAALDSPLFRSLCFRFFNVYGVGQDPASPYSGVMTIFANALKEERCIALNGGGVCTRDFIHVQDVVGALVQAVQWLTTEHSSAFASGNAMNLGSGVRVSIRLLAELMKEQTHSVSELQSAPWRDGDVKDSLANIDRAREVLRWEPKVALDSGISTLF